MHYRSQIEDGERQIPHLFKLRCVPRKCYQILPLEVMKKYQCVVVGRTEKKLTIAITDMKCLRIFTQLRLLTGCQLFPVLVDTGQMHRFLLRIERTERMALWTSPCAFHVPCRRRVYTPSIHTMLRLLTLPDRKFY